MLVAYLDEVAEAGAFVSKTHKNYNGSPAFGYAGFVIPSDQVRVMSQYFTEKKRRLFAHLIPVEATAGTWERKGSDIFTPVAWDTAIGVQSKVFANSYVSSAPVADVCFSMVKRNRWALPQRGGGKTLGFKSRDSLSLSGAVSIKPSIGSVRMQSVTGKT